MQLPVDAQALGGTFWIIVAGMCGAFSLILGAALDDRRLGALAFPFMLAGAVGANILLLDLVDVSIVDGPVDGVVIATMMGALPAALLVALALRWLTD